MRKAVTILAVILLTPVSISATSQDPDVLIYKGQTYQLFANPLEPFFKSAKERPKFFVRPGTVTSGNWRGYVATWEIEDGFLYLVKIDSWICRKAASSGCRKANLNSLFGTKYRGGKVRADWFSGELRMPDGNQIQYVHMGYGSIYEREIVLRVESGKVVESSTVDNTKKMIPSVPEPPRPEPEKTRPGA